MITSKITCLYPLQETLQTYLLAIHELKSSKNRIQRFLRNILEIYLNPGIISYLKFIKFSVHLSLVTGEENHIMLIPSFLFLLKQKHQVIS